MSKAFLADIIGNQSLTDGVNRMGVNDDGSLNVVVISGGGGGGGDASAANQVIGNASLASIDSKTPVLDGNGHVPVYLDSCPLPTGAATSALQTTGNAKLDSIIAALVSVPVTGTFFQSTQPVSLASQPLPTGASTAAKQPALGTAGTASADVISIQGVASMTPVKVDGSGVTQPVSATALPLPTGAAQDATLTGGTQKTKLVDSGGTNVATISSGGALKVDASATTQPVSIATAPVLVAGSAVIGKVGIDQTTPGTTNLVQDVADGPVTSGTAATKSMLIGGVINTSVPSTSAGKQIALQLDLQGNIRTNSTGGAGSCKSVLATGTGSAQASLTVPAATKWLVKSVYSVLTMPVGASAVAIALLVLDASSNVVGTFVAGANSGGASSTTAITWGPNCPTTTAIVSNNLSVGIPPLTLGPGMQILFDGIGVAAGAAETLNALVEAYPD